jgi:hypothetical protein
MGLMEELKVGWRKDQRGKIALHGGCESSGRWLERENDPGGTLTGYCHTSMEKAEDDGRYGGTYPVGKARNSPSGVWIVAIARALVVQTGQCSGDIPHVWASLALWAARRSDGDPTSNLG